MISTILADVGWVGLWIGAIGVLVGAILIVVGFIEWLVKGWERDER